MSPGSPSWITRRPGAKGDLANRTPVELLEDGDYFGEIALLRNVPRTASVRALDECLLLSLPRQHFQALLQKAPGLRAKFEDLAATVQP